MADRRKALGRGIGALIPGASTGAAEAVSPDDYTGAVTDGDPRTCAVEEIMPNRFQPRRRFDEATLDELVASIEEKGILEPLIVRPLPDDAKTEHTAGVVYELIAGERRWRAAQKARVARVPIVVYRLNDQEALEAALIENVMRDDLTPIEEAEGYQRLLDLTGMSQTDLADRIGKDRSHVSNTVRLLKLSPRMREDLARGKLSAGHGRALLALDAPDLREEMYRAIVSQGLSVRQAEKYVTGRKSRGAPTKTARRPGPHFDALGKELTRELGATVTVHPKRGRGGGQGGVVTISCSSATTLDKVIARLRGGG